MAGRVVVFGSLNVDFRFGVPRLPFRGETVGGAEFAVLCGGKGANQAVAVARLGAPVALVGRVGGDYEGRQLIDVLMQNGVDTSGVFIDPDAITGRAAVVVDEAGDNLIVVAPGANHRNRSEDVSSAVGRLAAGDVLVMQMEIPRDAVISAAVVASRKHCRVILNAAPVDAPDPELTSCADMLICNEVEASRLTGLPVSDHPSAEEAARRLAGNDAIAIVTLGRLGAVAVEGSTVVHVDGCSVTTVDTTAAGDAFVGAVAIGCLDHSALGDLLAFANAAGAAAVTRAGAMVSLPNREDVRGVMASVGAHRLATPRTKSLVGQSRRRRSP